MADFLDLKPGHRVQVKPAGGRERDVHVSSILAIAAASLVIEAPSRDGERLQLRPGDAVELSLQSHGRRYSFETDVEDSSDVLPASMRLRMPSAVAQDDRRDLYRLETLIDPRYAAITNQDGEEVERLKIVLADISGGGCRMRAPRSVPIGTRVRLIFALGADLEDLDLIAEVVSFAENERGGSYRMHARFVDLPRQIEDRIVRFVFSQQVELLQKGVL